MSSNLEPFAQLMEYIVDKIRTKSTFITNPENVVIGESLSLLDKPDKMFPRAELLIVKDKANGFIDQRQINHSLRISIGGHIKRDQDLTTPQDMYDAVSFGNEIMNVIYTMHEDNIQGIEICDGFIQVGGFNEIFYEYELFPRTTTVIVIAEVQIETYDTFTNN